MSTPAEREAREAVKQALMLADLAYRGHGGEMRSHMEQGAVITRQQLHALEHYIGKAILAAARERVEALRVVDPNGCLLRREEYAYNDAIADAARAITPEGA